MNGWEINGCMLECMEVAVDGGNTVLLGEREPQQLMTIK
jgi:hypothetical protein